MVLSLRLDPSANRQKIGISRSIISKTLQRAKDLGIVEIFIKDETYYTVDLEQKLEEKFGLEEAIVVATHDMSEEEALNFLAKEAAYTLSKRIAKVKTLGISWGKQFANLLMNSHSSRIKT